MRMTWEDGVLIHYVGCCGLGYALYAGLQMALTILALPV
ncbi:MAG: hypothetical protein HJJLKODD_02605 [Phycisphaerae bacterium]|nr:hypothetical protein [Phycisphaerae bacterium]